MMAMQPREQPRLTTQTTRVRRATDPDSNLFQLRLPQGDIDALGFLFGGLESAIGLRSTFGTMLEAQQAKYVGREEPKPRQVRRNGVLVAHGVEDPTIHVKAEDTFALDVDEPLRIEAWSCWSNHTVGSLGYAVQEAREALVIMVERKQVPLVVVLCAMYGGTTPKIRYAEFRELGDLVPLATMTRVVRDHAAHLTQELRADLALGALERAMATDASNTTRPCRCEGSPHLWMLCPHRETVAVATPGHARWVQVRGPVGRRETVTTFDALHDLLRPDAKAQRVRLTAEIRTQAHRSLIEASNAYRSAKAAE